MVPYRTLHRFASERCGFGRKETTVRVADGQPGIECQIDFGYLGMFTDTADGRRRKVYALIFTAVYSRHMFVWLSYSQTLAAVIAGCQAAWEFFGGVFAVLIPDNLKPVVTAADPLTPRLSAGWLDYAAHAGFATDAARVASPKDKPRVERAVQYVRGNFWDGKPSRSGCCSAGCGHLVCPERRAADPRHHLRPPSRGVHRRGGTPAAGCPGVYDIPVFKAVKIHRDYHAEVGKALYSLPECWIGQTLDVRADSELVRFYHRGCWSRSTPASRPAVGTPTPPICPSTSSATR